MALYRISYIVNCTFYILHCTFYILHLNAGVSRFFHPDLRFAGVSRFFHPDLRFAGVSRASGTFSLLRLS